MKNRLMGFLVAVFPLFCAAQSEDSIAIFLNKKQIAVTAFAEHTDVELSKKASGKLCINFPKDTSYNRSIIVMNDQRNPLVTRVFGKKSSCVFFTVKELVATTKGQSFSLYVLNLPSDPAMAATMRMAPVLFCRVDWVD